MTSGSCGWDGRCPEGCDVDGDGDADADDADGQGWHDYNQVAIRVIKPSNRKSRLKAVIKRLRILGDF